jgi:hypothetical protein
MIFGKISAAQSTDRTPTAQHRCAVCGVAGRLSLADPSPDDGRLVLRLDWSDGVRLLCPSCRGGGS